MYTIPASIPWHPTCKQRLIFCVLSKFADDDAVMDVCYWWADVAGFSELVSYYDIIEGNYRILSRSICLKKKYF